MDMKKSASAKKQGTGLWYSERGTTTEPCSFDPNLEWIVRCGLRICLVEKRQEA